MKENCSERCFEGVASVNIEEIIGAMTSWEQTQCRLKKGLLD